MKGTYAYMSPEMMTSAPALVPAPLAAVGRAQRCATELCA